MYLRYYLNDKGERVYTFKVSNAYVNSYANANLYVVVRYK
jgi:hypothetical protein